MQRNPTFGLLLVLSLAIALPVGAVGQGGGSGASVSGLAERAPDYRLMLRSRQFVPHEGVSADARVYAEHEASKHAIVQFRSIPDETEVRALSAHGIVLLGYLPNYAYFARIPEDGLAFLSDLPNLRSALPIRSDDKISPFIRTGGIARHARNEDGTARLVVVFFSDVTTEDALSMLGAYGEVRDVGGDSHRFMVDVREALISDLAGRDQVQWIEQVPPDKREALDDCRATIGADIVQAPPYSLDGSGVTLGIWDSGSIATTHQDFLGRLTIPDGSGTSNHSTMTGGCMAGDGSRSVAEGGTPLQWRGISTAADIVSYDWPSSLANLDAETGEAINTYGAISSSNSWIWGLCSDFCSYYGEYDDWSQEYDRLVRGSEGAPISVVFAAGNDQDCVGCEDSIPNFPYGTVAGPGGTSKNTIVVGATNAITKTMTSFSGWGPVKDGRVKPDVVAPGCKPSGGVKTTYPPNTYSTACGTSFSTPIVAGCLGILMQEFADLGYVGVKPHTLKAVLVQSVEDLGNTGPDYQYGHGHVELDDAVDLVIANYPANELIRIDNVADGEEDTFYMDVPAGAGRLRVTLVWDDFEGTPFAAKTLVNDLDLMLMSPGGSWYFAYTLDPTNPSQPAGRGYNNLDNVEVVEVENPAEGRWAVRVRGSVVPEAPQEYTVVLPYEYPSARIDSPVGKPMGFRLYPNMPNPFSSLTFIRFDLPEASPVRLHVYDTRGRVVRTLVDESLRAAGRHTVYWDGTADDGSAVAPGIYFCRIVTRHDARTQRMVLVY